MLNWKYFELIYRNQLKIMKNNLRTVGKNLIDIYCIYNSTQKNSKKFSSEKIKFYFN